MHGNKPALNVVVHVEEPFVTYNRATAKYEGFVYDIWRKVRSALWNEYTVHESYADTDNFSAVLETYIRDRGYHLAIGAFSVFPERLTYCSFSMPYVLDKHVLLTSNQIYWSKTLPIVVKKYLFFVLPFAFLGFLFAVVFRMLRVKHFSCANTISAMLGNRDFLGSQRGSEAPFASRACSCLCIFCLALIATYTFVYINALITRTLYGEYTVNRITVANIKGKKLLCAKGFSAGGLFEEYGAHVEYRDIKDEQLVKEYHTHNTLFARKQYDGIVTTYLNSLHKHATDVVRMENSTFGYDKYCFGVHPQSQDILQRINIILSRLNDSHDIAAICASHFGLANKHLGVL